MGEIKSSNWTVELDTQGPAIRGRPRRCHDRAALGVSGDGRHACPGGAPEDADGEHYPCCSADEDGRPRAIAPILEIGGERVTPAGLVKKVWAYRFMGPLREGLLSIRAETEADRREWVLPVEEVSAPLFVVDPVRVRSKTQRVQLIVRGQDVPPPDALDVYATEGRVLSVRSRVRRLPLTLSCLTFKWPVRCLSV